MKNLISAIIIFGLGVLCAWAFFSATAETQALRETAELRDCATAPTGAHCKMANGREAIIITAKGAK